MVDGSQFLVELAANLVCEEFKLDTQVLDWPGQELYVGFTIDDDGELWQDFAHRCSYTASGVDYTSKDELALWYDAQHPTAAGAQANFRRLVAALQEQYQFGDSNLPKGFALHV